MFCNLNQFFNRRNSIFFYDIIFAFFLDCKSTAVAVRTFIPYIFIRIKNFSLGFDALFCWVAMA